MPRKPQPIIPSIAFYANEVNINYTNETKKLFLLTYLNTVKKKTFHETAKILYKIINIFFSQQENAWIK